MLKAVIFDFGQTLVDSADGFRSAEKIAKEKIFNHLFSNHNSGQWEVFLSEYRQIRKKFHAESNFSRSEIWHAVCDCFERKTDLDFLEGMETEYWDTVKSKTNPFPETLDVLQKLIKKYQLGIITNTQGQKSKDNHRIALFPEIEKFFETIIIAGESKIPAKPHGHPFDLCLKEMRLEPDEAMYVGDDFQKDIVGAGHAGMHPVWLKHYSVKRSWPDPDLNFTYKTITDLNQLLKI
jgi:putative hydrolase of the HAD superfamily